MLKIGLAFDKGRKDEAALHLAQDNWGLCHAHSCCVGTDAPGQLAGQSKDFGRFFGGL